MTRITIFIVLALATCAVAGDETDNPYNLRSTKAVAGWRTYAHSIEVEKKRHERTLNEIRQTLLVDEQTARTAAARSGNADEIVRIDKAITDIKNDTVAANGTQWIAGSKWKWHASNTTLTFNANGTCDCPGGGWHGNWRSAGPNTVSIQRLGDGKVIDVMFTVSVTKRAAIEDSPAYDKIFGFWQRLN